MKFSNEQLLLVIVFFTGTIFGSMFFSFLSIEFDSKINISDLLSMALTATVGIYLGITITGRQSSSRFEKDFLINEAKRIIHFLDNNSVFKSTEEILHEDAKKGFKEVNFLLTAFENLLTAAEYCNGIEVGQVRESFRLYRRSILDLPPSNGIIKPTQKERFEIIKFVGDFRKEVFKVITTINSR